MNRAFELGKQYGTKRQKKEMLTWSKKRKHLLRREDLIGYVCGRNPPPRLTHSRVFVDKASPRIDRSALRHVRISSDLQPFCDALAVQGMNRNVLQRLVTCTKNKPNVS